MQLGIALDDGQAQENEDGKDQEPERQRNPRGGRARDDADGVEPGQRQHVHHHDFFDAKRVGQRGRVIATQDAQEGHRQGQRQKQGHQQQQGRHGETKQQTQLPCRERAMAFAVVLAVRLQVQHVVEQVHRGRTQAERDEGKEARPKRSHGHLMRGQHGHEDQGILGPLVHTQGLQHHLDADRRCGHHVADHGHLRCGQTDRLGRIDHDGRARLGPNGHIDPVIAAVIEGAFTESRHQLGRLVVS